jgi:CDP-paratose 2-epimerase
VARFIDFFIQTPRVAQVYNLGGGKDNTCSILEAFSISESISGKKMDSVYVDKNREGDHICYYSDLRKMKEHFPGWDITKSLKDTIEEIVKSWQNRMA